MELRVPGRTPRLGGTWATYRLRRSTRSSVRTVFVAMLLCVLVGVLPILEASVPEARAATPNLLLGRPHVGEYQPVRGERFLAWQQNTRRKPDHFDVYARPLTGGGRFKINAPKTNGANGDIDGDVLVYQQFNKRKSDLKFFDLVDRERTSPPQGVDTDQWEYWPSMSGRYLMFGRLYRDGLRRIVLFDLSTLTSRGLDRVRGADSFLGPGQVNGDYAVWYKCRSNTECDVVRYHIPEGTSEEIPNPGGRQYAPSVAPDGTVYFARSRGRCGTGVRLVRRPLDGEATVLWRLPGGDDVGTTNVYANSQGVNTVLYDHFACEERAESDAWEIEEDASPELSVTLAGDGSGTVTSAPSGIQCGSDCTESYDSGTGVTLTAAPLGDAAFAGWSGACTGANRTCTLTVDGPTSVTATFTADPVLNVEKTGAGGGTVISTPAGINCGNDCNQPYDEGTSVSLAAVPAADSTFGGWSGACSGTSGCTVNMNTSKSVTATFDLKPPVLLTVTIAPDGSGLRDE